MAEDDNDDTLFSSSNFCLIRFHIDFVHEQISIVISGIEMVGKVPFLFPELLEW